MSGHLAAGGPGRSLAQDGEIMADTNRLGMTRRQFLAGLVAGAATAHLRSLGKDSSPRLNVLFISSDDLNCSLGCYGNEVVKTPNIDRLARRGVRFTHCYAQFASCAPSRFSFLSGWYPERTGVCTFGPKSRDGALRKAIYLPQHFRKSGYTTMRLDKIFHIGKDDAASWDITEEPYRDASGQFKAIWTGIEIKMLGLTDRVLREGRYDKVRGEKGPYAVLDVEDGDLFDGRNATRAVELLEQCARNGKPFFLGLGFRRPHLPWIAPKRYFDMYPPEKIPLPPADPNAAGPPRLTKTEHQEMIAHYYAAVTYLDTQVGRVLDALNNTGLAKNTVVVLFGDQGYCLGERNGHFGKGTLWERSLIVPLIIAVPGQENAGGACERVVELLDMYPTLVDLCGLPKPGVALQGRSLVPLLRDPQAAWEERAVSAWGRKDGQRPALSVRTARYRYTEKADGTPDELIDYRNDPYERENLVDDPDHTEVRAKLRAILRQDRG